MQTEAVALVSILQTSYLDLDLHVCGGKYKFGSWHNADLDLESKF